MSSYTLSLTQFAQEDLKDAEFFYENQSENLGVYFRDSLISDLDALLFYAGVHEKHFGYYRMLTKRFPFSVYYDIEDGMIIIHAILDSRSNLQAHSSRLA